LPTIGVALGTMLAVPVGFVLGWYRVVRSFVDPLINSFRALAPGAPAGGAGLQASDRLRPSSIERLLLCVRLTAHTRS
jgi:hypothetical protein